MTDRHLITLTVDVTDLNVEWLKAYARRRPNADIRGGTLARAGRALGWALINHDAGQAITRDHRRRTTP